MKDICIGVICIGLSAHGVCRALSSVYTALMTACSLQRAIAIRVLYISPTHLRVLYVYSRVKPIVARGEIF